MHTLMVEDCVTFQEGFKFETLKRYLSTKNKNSLCNLPAKLKSILEVLAHQVFSRIFICFLGKPFDLIIFFSLESWKFDEQWFYASFRNGPKIKLLPENIGFCVYNSLESLKVVGPDSDFVYLCFWRWDENAIDFKFKTS